MNLLGILQSLLAFIVAIGVLVTVHEFGHFWVARRMGVKVLRFSVGFGRPLWRWRSNKDQTEYVIGSLPLGVTYRIGMRLPAHCTATGKALLSTLPDEQIRALYRGAELGKLTTHSHSTLTGLLADLNTTRLRGYAIDNEETREGMCCFGAPVFDASGDSPTERAAASHVLSGRIVSGSPPILIKAVSRPAISPLVRDRPAGVLCEQCSLVCLARQMATSDPSPHAAQDRHCAWGAWRPT